MRYPRSIPLHRLRASRYCGDGAIHSYQMGEKLRLSSEKQLLTYKKKKRYVTARPPCHHGLEQTDRTVEPIFEGFHRRHVLTLPHQRGSRTLLRVSCSLQVLERMIQEPDGICQRFPPFPRPQKGTSLFSLPLKRRVLRGGPVKRLNHKKSCDGYASMLYSA